MPPPPAPNRERVDRFTWNRHYFRDRTPLGKFRWWFCVAATVVGLGWVLVGLSLPTEKKHYQVTHGPVASVHAAWDHQCDACHAGHSLSEFSPADLLNSQSVHGRWNEFRCETCHAGQQDVKVYAPHHADAKSLECAACHRDHQGRDFSLVKLPVGDCTQCHQDLKEHHRFGAPKFAAKITGFESDHPEFNGAKKDFQRTLNFSHAHHMMAGIPASPEAAQNRTNGAYKIGEIPERFRERYRAAGQSDKDLVQLTCASCHQLDSNRLAADPPSKAWQATENLVQSLPLDSVLPPRAAGAYFQAINYELNCQACHPIQATVAAKPNGPMTFGLPHRLSDEQVDKQVRLSVISELTKQKGPAAILKENRDRLDPLDDTRRKQLKTLDEEITALTAAAKKQLLLKSPDGVFGMTCGKCHQMQAKVESFAVKPPTTPAIWYPHAKFDHSAHRAMTCVSCHTEKSSPPYEGGAGGGISAADLRAKIEKPEPVDVPGIANCRQCHAPAQRVEVHGQMEARGGVRHECVECHRFHNGDASLQGLGSPRRDPPDSLRLDTSSFLRGTPK